MPRTPLSIPFWKLFCRSVHTWQSCHVQWNSGYCPFQLTMHTVIAFVTFCESNAKALLTERVHQKCFALCEAIWNTDGLLSLQASPCYTQGRLQGRYPITLCRKSGPNNHPLSFSMMIAIHDTCFVDFFNALMYNYTVYLYQHERLRGT